MISNFPVKSSYNQGGYTSFKFVPGRLVAAYPLISAGSTIAPLQFHDNNTWLNGYATRGTLVYREEPQTDVNGTLYVKTVTGFAPGDSPLLIDLLDVMSTERFVLLVKDVFGRQRLVGSPVAPLEFSAVFDSGGQMSDEKGFRFTFSGNGLWRSPLYNA